jgi:hypothetical protein
MAKTTKAWAQQQTAERSQAMTEVLWRLDE